MIFIEIIVLFFLSKKNGDLAQQKGLKPGTWKFYTVGAWIIAEAIGGFLGVLMFADLGKMSLKEMAQISPSTMIAISGISVFAAFGGYLLVRYMLENKRNNTLKNDIKRVGVDDLAPPKK